MADFCAPCAAEIFDLTDGTNDLADPARTGWWWLLCEGCGFHRFDGRGHRLCTHPPEGLPRADHPGTPSLAACTACLYVGSLLDEP